MVGPDFGGWILQRILALTVMMGLAACSDFPDLPRSSTANAANGGYPHLLPLDQIQTAAPPVGPGLGVGDLPARARALQARAARLRQTPVVDGTTRARMQAALRRHR